MKRATGFVIFPCCRGRDLLRVRDWAVSRAGTLVVALIPLALTSLEFAKVVRHCSDRSLRPDIYT